MRVRSVCMQHFFFMEEDANEVLSSIKHRKHWQKFGVNAR